MTCPECGRDDVLVGCSACPLICCYECALDRPSCDRQSDLWPVNAASKKLKGDKQSPGVPVLRGGRVFIHRSPSGHIWGPAT
jgi:hypothetical protein